MSGEASLRGSRGFPATDVSQITAEKLFREVSSIQRVAAALNLGGGGSALTGNLSGGVLLSEGPF